MVTRFSDSNNELGKEISQTRFEPGESHANDRFTGAKWRSNDIDVVARD
jgi:hypothetical protein